ncbi:MAG: xanthine dehydrogenase accessory protein XdhC [Oscillospiraceae bacterium]|nr:xanthine dehydrogenase accessory protein XdhC [Oscillospiraceae bacterium]
MKEMLERILAALGRGERVTLCSVLHADGSAPRGAGARMAVFEDGTALGTVGGGPMEYMATQFAREVLSRGTGELRTYELAPDQAGSIGAICGGRVTVYFQYLDGAQADSLEALRRWRTVLDGNENAWLVLRLDGEQVRQFRVLTESELSGRDVSRFTARAYFQDGVYIEPLFRAGRVYLFGGGHVGRALVPVLSYVGFRVTVIDQRAEIARAENFPEAEQVIRGDFSDIFASVSIGPEDYAVIMTPGHQGDYEILAQVLTTQATYIGCIGSKLKVARTKERLQQAGFDETAIARLHSPIGLPILAETPEEIAISIAAEMIRHRAQHSGE